MARWKQEDPEEAEVLEEIDPEGAHKGRTFSLPTSYPCRKGLLTHLQEIDLCSRAQAGDMAARQEMMEANLRLVMSIARRYKARSLCYEDFVQEGIIGLLDAIQKYDVQRGYRFSTYASWWIRQGIARAIEKSDRMIRLPSHSCRAVRKAQAAESQMEDELGRTPTITEIAASTGISRVVLQALVFFDRDPLSLDAMMGQEDGCSLGAIIVDPTAIDPEDNSVAQAVGEVLADSLARLPDKERFVLERRFGFFDGSPWPLQSIANQLGMSREGIRHVERRAIHKMRDMLKDNPALHLPLVSYSSSV